MLIALGAVILLLIAFRIALPSILHDYVNRKLDEIPDYDGHVGDIDVALLRGAYTIKDVDLVKTSGKVEVPFVEADRVDLSVQWHALFEGSWVGEMKFERAKLNFVSGPTKAQSQQSIDKSWLPTVDDLFPLKINKVTIDDSEIHYRDFHRKPKIDLLVDSVYVVATNLTNSKDLSDDLFAVIEGRGVAMKQAPMRLHVETDPNAKDTTFDLNLSLRKLKLVELNEWVKSVGGIDFEKGRLDVDTELAASNGRIHGYVKPIFHDVKIVDVEEDIDNPLKLLWETVVGALGKIFTNQGKDQMATVIPIRGRTDEPGTSLMPVLGGLLKNAFVEALKPGIEGTVDLEKAETSKKKKAEKETKKEVNEEKKEDSGG
jgi:hypothetical protein